MKNTFEDIYDSYCPMLYGIAIQLCPTINLAEKILILTFQKADDQNLHSHSGKPIGIDLLKLMIQTAQEELFPGEKKCNFKIKQFEKTPMMHTLLVDQLSVEEYCIENNVTRDQALLNIRKEFMLLRNAGIKNTIEANVAPFQHN